MEALVTLLIVLIVLVVVWYIVKTAATALGIPDVVVTLIGLVLGLIFLLYAIKVLLPVFKFP
jgi:hypothetical protein